MLKRTLVFQSAGHLSLSDKQLCFNTRKGTEEIKRTVPIEDLGIILVENPRITITSALLQALAVNNTIVIFCDEKHMPASFFSAMTSNEIAQKSIHAQLNVSEALKNRLWKQTVVSKIRNQAQVLFRNGKKKAAILIHLAGKVRNGDPENIEGTAARFYFKELAPSIDFLRDPDGVMPNAALNYGYAVIRSAMARALTGSGLLCISGIHHHNQYNPFCLADDIMEPYRAYVDDEVFGDSIFWNSQEITGEMKQKLLSLLSADVMIRGMKRPLQNAMSYTSASLVRCFMKEQQGIDYPEFCLCPVNSQPRCGNGRRSTEYSTLQKNIKSQRIWISVPYRA